MALKLITAPAAEPVSTSEAKSHLRVDTTADDTYIGTLITVARQNVESHLRRALISQTWEVVLDAFPAGVIRLPKPPLASVTSIKYTDDEGNESTYSSDNYVVDSDTEPGRVVLKSGQTWPAVTLAAANGVRVRYVAGYGAAGSNVPQAIRQAILLVIGSLYENREDVLVAQGVSIGVLPFGVVALLAPYRIYGW
jgi:uncharacterized phiE125 gp8 family phage protein